MCVCVCVCVCKHVRTCTLMCQCFFLEAVTFKEKFSKSILALRAQVLTLTSCLCALFTKNSKAYCNCNIRWNVVSVKIKALRPSIYFMFCLCYDRHL